MNRNLLARFLGAIALFVLAACATVPWPGPPLPRQRWAVLVPGLFDDASRFDYLRPVLRARGWHVLDHAPIPNDGSVSIRKLAWDLGSEIKRTIPPQDEIIVVGFSMGGLVARSYVQEGNGAQRVKGLLTIACPNEGTQTARLLGGAAAGPEMTPGSPLLDSLNRGRRSELGRVRHRGAIYSALDGVIIPPSSGHLPDSWNLQVPAMIHGNMLTDRQVIEAVAAFLGAAAGNEAARGW